MDSKRRSTWKPFEEKHDSEVRSMRRIVVLTAELAQLSANLLTVTAKSDKIRAELAGSVGSSVFKPSNLLVLVYSLF